MSEIVDKVTKSLERSMKKGYTTMILLVILKDEPCHGYKLIKEIEKRTLGMWTPTSSLIYPMLDSMEKRGFIKGIESTDDPRKKNIYHLTTEGEKLLNKLIEKQKIMRKSLRSLFLGSLTTLTLPDDFFVDDFNFLPLMGPLTFMNKRDDEVKLRFLKRLQEIYSEILARLSSGLKNLTNSIHDLEKKMHEEKES